MRKLQLGNIGVASVLVATSFFVGLDAKFAVACSSAGSSGSGLSHGSSLESDSVTVCVGSSSITAGTSTTQTITKTSVSTVKLKSTSTKVSKPVAKAVSKPVSKPAGKAASAAPKPVAKTPSCPSASQIASMPKSPDATERWVASVCSPAAAPVAAPKPISKLSPKPKLQPKTKTKTTTELVTIETPASKASANGAVKFYPKPLTASVSPYSVLSIGQSARFVSDAGAHFGTARVLGSQAEVHFVPRSWIWSFSSGELLPGNEIERSFDSAGKYRVRALVEYSVSYRLLGQTNWQAVEGRITVRSNFLELVVGDTGLKADQNGQVALLVGEDCVGRSGVFGCQN